jgi:hypothetical protein
MVKARSMFEKCDVDPWLFLPNPQSFITDPDPGGQFTVSGSYLDIVWPLKIMCQKESKSFIIIIKY